MQRPKILLKLLFGYVVDMLQFICGIVGKTLCYTRTSTEHFLLIIVQRDATQSSLFIILQVHSKCFGCLPHPSSGVHKTVTTASGTGHIFCAVTSLQRGQAWQRWREVAAQ